MEAGDFSNARIAKKLREVAAAYTVTGANQFQIRAYENAASVIEGVTSEVKDLWEEGNLSTLPGVGGSLQAHLNELFTTGRVQHWEEAKKGIPEGFFAFLDISGVGPKTALELTRLGAKDFQDLETKLEAGSLVKRGFSPKIAEKILVSLKNMSKSQNRRMMLPYASVQAKRVLHYLRDCEYVEQADILGSLRRMVPTVGDLDFAIASNKPKEIVACLVKMPGVKEIVNQGEDKVTLRIESGLQLDFLIVKPESYGALLQHSTGSKAHNIHLRTIAERKGLSLSEYGIRKIKDQKSKIKNTFQKLKIIKTSTEEEFYQTLGMQTPPPEIREDTGEIELALKHQLPKLVNLEDIKGDLHVHDNFPIEPSHDLGQNSLDDLVKKAKRLGYQYLGIADHSPSVSRHTREQIVDLIKRHNETIEQKNSSQKIIRVLKLLEVDIQPDGTLSVPDEGLELLDFAIASVHSSFHQNKDQMTQRILKAISHPYVKVLGHPTGRLINQRESYEVDWEKVFKFAAENDKALEINAYPDRLDLPEHLVRKAKEYGVKFVIGTDSHFIDHLENMQYGVAVARRGWAEKEDIVNAWDWTKFAAWFKIK